MSWWLGALACGIVVWGGCPLTATLFMLIHVTKRKLYLKNYPHRDSFLKCQGSSHPVDHAVCLLPYARDVQVVPTWSLVLWGVRRTSLTNDLLSLPDFCKMCQAAAASLLAYVTRFWNKAGVSKHLGSSIFLIFFWFYLVKETKIIFKQIEGGIISSEWAGGPLAMTAGCSLSDPDLALTLIFWENGWLQKMHHLKAMHHADKLAKIAKSTSQRME